MNKRPRFAIAIVIAASASVCTAASSGPFAASDDPLQAPECRAAIDSLQAQESAADADALAGDATAARDGRAPSPGLLRHAARRRGAVSPAASIRLFRRGN